MGLEDSDVVLWKSKSWQGVVLELRVYQGGTNNGDLPMTKLELISENKKLKEDYKVACENMKVQSEYMNELRTQNNLLMDLRKVTLALLTKI